MAELCEAILHNNKHLVKDSIGSCFEAIEISSIVGKNCCLDVSLEFLFNIGVIFYIQA